MNSKEKLEMKLNDIENKLAKTFLEIKDEFRIPVGKACVLLGSVDGYDEKYCFNMCVNNNNCQRQSSIKKLLE